ncbi:ureidoglycolate hydrolase [Hypoxylon crocopeplum]|nr:ureidoglycolate hydrolase [Hypoxylon crocopeplum]
MVLVRTLPIPGPLTLTAEPLSPSSFAPFGAVLANPAPGIRPQNAAGNPLPSGGIVANQGTAIQYRALAPPLKNLYAQAPSGKPESARTTMFVCGARQLLSDAGGHTNTNAISKDGLFEVRILERHPYTTQTFIPLGASPESRYLVIVAPTLAPVPALAGKEDDLPAPGGHELPGPGLPDLNGLRAFVATGAQAVTYGAGTWHAPMAALGPAGSALDFVVMQFANDIPVEDCQEVALDSVGQAGKGKANGKEGERRIMVRVPRRTGLWKL